MNKKIVALFMLLIAITAGSYYIEFHHNSGLKELNPTTAITVVDGTGQKIVLPEPAKRVVTLTGSDGELALALGIKPVGVVKSSDLPKDVQKELAQYTQLGNATGPSLERILQEKPNIVIGVAMPFQVTLRKALQDNGIPAYYHIAHSYDEIMKQIEDIGMLTGKDAEAKALVEKYNSHLVQLQKVNATKKAPRILIVFGTPVSYQLATSRTYVGDIFAKLGAENVADQYLKGPAKTSEEIAKQSPTDSLMEGFIPLNLETMSVLEPDMVLIVMHGSTDSAVEAFKKAFHSPAWRNIRAIRENKVYILPGESFSTVPTARMNEVLDYGEEVLYGKGN